ncbi:MAG TPA: SET domain-containing protein-lysine N-methyltransferase [Caulobacteraceae bacterium]
MGLPDGSSDGGGKSPLPAPTPPALAIVPAPQPITPPNGLAIRHIGTGEALYAARAFAAGEPVFKFAKVSWRPRRDRYTVETPEGQHLYEPLLARVGHACDPNTRPSFDLMALIARRDIAAGEAITFDYLTTELAIADPFDCYCGALTCRGRIETPPG